MNRFTSALALLVGFLLIGTSAHADEPSELYGPPPISREPTADEVVLRIRPAARSRVHVFAPAGGGEDAPLEELCVAPCELVADPSSRVVFRVEGTKERGELVVPEAPGRDLAYRVGPPKQTGLTVGAILLLAGLGAGAIGTALLVEADDARRPSSGPDFRDLGKGVGITFITLGAMSIVTGFAMFATVSNQPSIRKERR